MDNNGQGMRHEVALALKDNMDEIVESIIERFLDEYPMSVSSSLSHSALRFWSVDELNYLIDALEADAVPQRDFSAYVGDAGVNVSPFFSLTVTLVETWLFIGRALAPFVWRNFAGDPYRAKAALCTLERIIIKIIQVITKNFLENQLVEGSLLKDWSISPNRPENVTGYAKSDTKVFSAPISPSSQRSRLTQREQEIIRLVALGKTNGEIAAELELAQSTVKNRVSSIFDKLNVNTRTELTRWAIDSGLV